ncbi:MAG: hypothetical protein V1702_04930 [Candidatus Woesearchaeota archaeon]
MPETIDDLAKGASLYFGIPEDKITETINFLVQKEIDERGGYAGNSQIKNTRWAVKVAVGLATAPDYMTENQPLQERIRLGNLYYKDLLQESNY